MNFRLLLIVPLALWLSACTISGSARPDASFKSLGTKIGNTKCIVVRTLTDRGARLEYPKEADQRRFDAEMRVAKVYFSERLASELKQLKKPVEVKRTGSCVEGLLITGELTRFNPGGEWTGGVTMQFASQLRVASSDETAIGKIAVSHNAGLNVAANVLSFAPVPVVSAVDSMPAVIDDLAAKAAKHIESTIQAK